MKFESRDKTYEFYLEKENNDSNYYIVAKINHFVDYSESYDYYRGTPRFNEYIKKGINHFKTEEQIKLKSLCPHDKLLLDAIEHPYISSNITCFNIFEYTEADYTADTCKNMKNRRANYTSTQGLGDER